MRGKNKSFIEDTIILFVIGIIIYAVYSFFFASDEEVEIQNEPAVVERNVSTDSQVDKDSINNEKVADEKINEDIIQTQREKPVQIEEETKDIIEAIPDDKIEVKKEITKEVKETETPNLSEITDIEIFYKSIEDKIYANIESNVDKTLIKDNAFVNIRVTILKDGRYEQLTFMDGSKDNFELFRSSITQVFPLKINDSLKENFPRYFRMKIEIK
ncbi:hypothetical protein AACT_1149 [Arcobacter acticola]|uniref:Uncharacterized protein n=1 Tax=Arcobacter acticola TaxID=1849015 RepID=A0A6M8EMW3_9BACT|nr:hypothetical protein [Arcobacter acticola]QKE28331.1 hypothetical protein AACT_1149 [Arcobacter acticola]